MLSYKALNRGSAGFGFNILASVATLIWELLAATNTKRPCNQIAVLKADSTRVTEMDDLLSAC